MKKWPTLFKKTVLGADSAWTIAVDGRTIIAQWGFVGGKNP